VPGVNNLGKYGRWDFAEFTNIYAIPAGFDALIERFVSARAA
jgi:type III restriction enzyme